MIFLQTVRFITYAQREKAVPLPLVSFYPPSKKSFVRQITWIYSLRRLLSYTFIEVSLPRHSTSITTEIPEPAMERQLLLYDSNYNWVEHFLSLPCL